MCLYICVYMCEYFFYKLIVVYFRYEVKQKEEETGEVGAGPCMNQYVSPSAITHLDDRNKERLTEEVRDILEGW